MSLPKQTDEIFSILSSGKFICASSCEVHIQRLFSIIEENFEELSGYFLHINLVLEKEEGFFYFSKNESKQDMERKISQAYRWIDILDFLSIYDNGFGATTRFTVADILVKVQMDPILKTRLSTMKYEGKNNERVEKMVNDLKRYNFVELEDDITNTYKVLDSYRYLQQLIMKIHIPEGVEER